MDDIIEISSLDGIDNYGSKSSVSGGKFGDGIELLMNNNTEASKKDPDGLGLDELDQLETDLNEIADASTSKGDIFSDSIRLDEPKPSVSFEEPKLASDTSKPTTSTWDGFEKFNDIPVNPEVQAPPKPAQSKEEMLREKFQLLRKLEMLEQKGVQLSKKYSMDSPILEMKGEYETIMDEKAKQNSIKFQGNILMTCINGIEFLNNRFDPFDLKLEGWSEQIADNMDDYDEVFGELYDKYKSKASMAPELKLLFQVGGSAAMLHMTNTMFKSAMPGMDDIMRQNPELMQQFTQAAVSSMGQQNPGFGNFMGGIMGGGQQMPPRGSPPGPTQPDYTQRRPEIIPPGPSNRPDIGMSRGLPDFGDSVNMEDNFGSISLNQGKQMTTESKPPTTPRVEMKGPSDLNHLLSGLKTKKVEVRQKEMMGKGKGKGNGSTISIDELKSINKDADIPRKSKRRPRSERNTVSLDI